MMKRLIAAMCIAWCIGSAYALEGGRNAQTETMGAESMKITITVNGKILTATLRDNSSARALVGLPQRGAVTIEMRDYGNFEKVGELPIALPRNDTPTDTDAGDLILYQGKSFVIYYDKNSWNFTPLGKLEGIGKSELRALLGEGNVRVVLENVEDIQ